VLGLRLPMARPLHLAHAINLVLRFGLELAALYGFVRLGQSLGHGTASRWVLAFALPALMVVLWGSFIAPKARVVPPTWLRLALELVIFGAASYGVATAHGSSTGWLFFVLSTLSSWLNAATARRAAGSRAA